jgi:hypothetical protein
MKLWQIVGIVVIGLIFLYKDNDSFYHHQARSNHDRQEQQEDPRIMRESLQRLSYYVVYHSPNAKEDRVADIRWLKKAALIAINKGIPYFNIMDQKMVRKARPKADEGRNTIEGTIQLSPDPTGAEYDATEINSLVLAEDEK